MLFTAGNLGLSLTGLCELLTRLSIKCRLDSNNVNALRTLLRIMDVSSGKHVLAEASRGSIVIKTFSTNSEPSQSSSQSTVAVDNMSEESEAI